MVTSTSPPAPNAPSTLKKHSASTTQKAKQIAGKNPQKKIFAVFMDYKNLDDSLPGGTKKFSDFSWLLNPILEQGIMVFRLVFIPDNYTNRAEIHQLSDKHGFLPILCTRKIQNAVMKNVDTVDAKMESTAINYILHTDVTDIVIISGDADFQGLINFAVYNQKRVTVVSAARACSGRFLEMAEIGKIKLEIIK